MAGAQAASATPETRPDNTTKTGRPTMDDDFVRQVKALLQADREQAGFAAQYDRALVPTVDMVKRLVLQIDCMNKLVRDLKRCVRGHHGALMPEGNGETGVDVPWVCERCELPEYDW